MAVHEPIDPRVRLAISQWAEDAPRGAVSTFCAEHDISRKSFYELRKRARVEGPAAVLEPRSRRPGSSPSELSDEVKEQAIGVRAALEASGLDHGPISVHEKMRAMGLDPVPSTASRPRPKPPADLPADTRVRTVTTAGTIHVDKVFYKLDVTHAFKHVLVVSDGNQPGDKITITDLEGEILAEHTRPAPGVTYVGNGRPRGPRPKTSETSPMS